MALISRREVLAGMGGLLAGPAAARIGAVELGVCSDTAHFRHAVQYGFDYFEPEGSEIAAMDAAAFEKFRAQVLASPIRCKAIRSLIRKYKVVGENVPKDEIQTYIDQTLDRCKLLGARVIVWGSSGSRNVPAGFPRERAWQQIHEFLRFLGDSARRRKMVVGIEHLRKAESNVINTVGEALHLVREVNHPSVKMIVDFFHLRKENEDPNVIWEARKQIVHFHFANPAGRTWPKNPSEDPEYRNFFAMLKRLKYRGGLTLEAPAGTFEKDGEEAMRFFREMLA